MRTSSETLERNVRSFSPIACVFIRSAGSIDEDEGSEIPLMALKRPERPACFLSHCVREHATLLQVDILTSESTVYFGFGNLRHADLGCSRILGGCIIWFVHAAPRQSCLVCISPVGHTLYDASNPQHSDACLAWGTLKVG